jgi:hypothetical protein
VIKLAFEIPIKYLKMFNKMADYSYVLAHLFKNEEYRNFYIEQRKNGRFTILDNSAFELDKAFDGTELMSVINELKPNCVIAPDVMGDGVATETKTTEFIEYIKQFNLNIEIMGVVHGKSFDEWIHCYNFLVSCKEISRIGMTFEYHFNVPEEATRKLLTQQWMERRIKLLSYLVKNNLISPDKKYHLLGASDCVEYRFLKKYPFIETADTSSPVVHGVNGIAYKDYGLPCEKIKERLDFSCSLTKKQINVINKNIQIVKRFSR